MLFLRVIFVIIHLLNFTNGCGILTHLSIANEALESFSDSQESHNSSYRHIILNNYDAFYAGSHFPDTMYSSLCFEGRYHQISEDTHWSPFINASVNYIRKTYSKPWSKEAEKLIAFTFGVACHQIADILWHSLGVDQGFLRVMANINFHGSFSAAHALADLGGDVFSMFEGDLKNFSVTPKWYYPVADLVKIYKDLYGEKKVNANVLIKCSSLLYAAWIAEKLAGDYLYTIFASKSPFLLHQLHDYFIGGKSDMAAWTSIIWHDVVHLIEFGNSTCVIPRNTLYIRCKGQQIERSLLKVKQTNSGSDKQRQILLIHRENVNMEDIQITQAFRGVYFNIVGETYHKVHTLEKKEKLFQQRKPDSNSIMLTTKNSFARLGWTLITGNLPGYGNVLITAAPWYGIPGDGQHGRVYIISTDKVIETGILNDIDNIADQILDGSENDRFGFSLTLLDFNMDGLNDLAVSAPSRGSNDLSYVGTVHIYYGNDTTGGVNSKADVIIIGQQKYYNLGTNLQTGDLNMDGNEDLIIGSKYAPMGGQQRGSVIVFFSKKRVTTSPVFYLSSEAQMTFQGEQNYSWFGHEVHFHNKTTIGSLLVISAPTYRICALKNCNYNQNDKQSVGKIYGYKLSVGGEWTLSFQVTGQSSFSQLGNSIALGNLNGPEVDILSVSCPTGDVLGKIGIHFPPYVLRQAGQVYLLSLHTLLNKTNVFISDLEYVALFEGNHDFGKFGWHVSWQDVNGDGLSDMILGAPYQTPNVYKPIEDEKGALYIYFGGETFPKGNATRNCGLRSLQPCPRKKASIYLSPNQMYSHFGQGTAALTFNKTQSIAVSAPRQDTISIHNGVIYLFPIHSHLSVQNKRKNIYARMKNDVAV